MHPIRTAYLTAARSAAALLADPAVAARWDAPSALAEFRVGGLAGHLAFQVLAVPAVLAEPVPPGEPIGLLDHYARGTWIGAAVDDEVNVGIRSSGERVAADGPDALRAAVDPTVDRLAAALPAEPAGRVVHLARGPWSLALDDYLTTRLMELAVHSDDLAVSVGVPTPELPAEVLDPVFALLTRLAVRRHGQPAVLRALSRAERAPASVTAF
ncbi:maleylpyruvate isomerase N-terminal domain-containing protein [Micromonospora chaiyaphumensis]|uniref:Mycothiol maleylpyruvate isomerase N-terminal domain-containing protein n=1 Tax=Micromonospora chaiyaphumensis TaxID=307119 RepID=A0A1C4Z3V1_9ACTN|nr:maleylpyruvate isomerase N-terminal domain-containing protein [Micromonospora chaiyaphumensis]SCF27567.1 Mycothiol maleylpyruvate isomerase N-terminal domain-containing protein [Micromonospora chaiyaphumensis]